MSNQARLTARWHGHPVGATLTGSDADRAVAAGRAEPIRTRKITKNDTSPTREPETEGTTDEPDGADTGS